MGVFARVRGHPCVEVRLFRCEVQAFLAGFEDLMARGFDLIYADPPWPTPPGGIDFSRNRGSAARPSKTTVAYVDFLKRALFDPLLSSVAGAAPARVVCLKSPSSFSELGDVLCKSCAYLGTRYVFDREIRMLNRRGNVVGYFHFLKLRV